MSSVERKTPLADGEQQGKTKLPKRLAMLCLLLGIASISGIIAKQGVLLCILTLFLIVAILGRQRTALYLLQLYSVIQLLIVSCLPLLLNDAGDLLIDNYLSYRVVGFEAQIPDYLVFGILIGLAMMQTWIVFTTKVKRYFNPTINLNILR